MSIKQEAQSTIPVGKRIMKWALISTSCLMFYAYDNVSLSRYTIENSTLSHSI